ncbi:MAG TPA: dual specificity protein phosphatase family protein [Candidatus Bathyarchaeia archaeon]|nr:dual specificity protein phosphatase family protein [Candidatus Bathyarchaeia archaeon]
MDFTEILANELWVGAAPTLADLEEIKKRGGGKAVIVDLTRNPREEEWANKLGLQYEDRTPKVEETFAPVPVSQLRLVARLIEQHVRGGRTVYLHCKMGLGRSPTCAAAYLVSCGIPLREAKELILSRRSVWNGEDGNYASGLNDFAKMLEITRLSE